MSRRDNMKRIFVGNLPPDVRTKDLEDLFYKYGKIAFIDLKTRRGPPFAFVEFLDYRDAEDAVRGRNGKEYDGQRLRVEFPRGRERPSRYKNGSGSSRSSAPQRRSKYRVRVSGLPPSGSWQDLKDAMREVGEVCFADVFPSKTGDKSTNAGVVEFVNYDDMRYAIKKLNNTKFRSHTGESSYIKLEEDDGRRSGGSRSRSRSPVASYSASRSPSRSPKPRRGGHHKRYHKEKRASRSRSRTPHSRSSSRSARSNSVRSRGSSSRSERSKTNSKTPSPTRSDRDQSPQRQSPDRHSDKGGDERRTPDKREERREESRTPSPEMNTD